MRNPPASAVGRVLSTGRLAVLGVAALTPAASVHPSIMAHAGNEGAEAQVRRADPTSRMAYGLLLNKRGEWIGPARRGPTSA